MLRYTTWGAKLIGVFSLLLFVASITFPFLEVFAFTPLIVFLHRFSITLEIGTFTKTLQLIFFLIPVLFVKSLFEYHKRYDIKLLLKTPLFKIIAALILTDIVGIIFSINRTTSAATFIAHGANYALFITSSIWLKIILDGLEKKKLQRISTKLLTIFASSLIIFSIVNAVASISQFVDCSIPSLGCKVWNSIDATFPNKLLEVGHQKFAYKPVVIRSPGFFGDVNFNGMIGLFISLIATGIYMIWEFMKKPKGYLPIKEQRFLLYAIIAGLIPFIFTLSRSAALGIAVLGVILLFLIIIPISKKLTFPQQLKKKIITFTGASFGTLILVLLIGFAVPVTYENRTTSLSAQMISYTKKFLSPDQKSAKGHATLFADAITIGNKKPVFGGGLGTYTQQYREFTKNPNASEISPHSTYALIYAEQGLFGSLIYLSIFVFIWSITIKSGIVLRDEFIKTVSSSKRMLKDDYILWGARFFTLLVAFAIPFFTIATVTYYGFFLPMVWWWGNRYLVD